MKRWLLTILCLAAAVGAARAGDTVTFHMLRASKTQPGIDARLQGVSPFLRQSLPFYQGFALLGKQDVAAPGAGTVTLLFGYRLDYDTTDGALSLAIQRNEQELVRHRVVLKPGKPHLIGPFPDPENKGDILFLLVQRPGG